MYARPQSMTFQDMIARFYESSELATKSITLVVTEDCTLRCTYCYEKHKSKKKMSKEVAKQTIDMLFEEREDGSGYLNPENSKAIILEFIGGEPLLAIDVIDYTVEYFKKKAIKLRHPWAENYMISMTTNGTQYFNEDVQRFIKRNQGRVSMTITIDGNKALHDSCRLFPDGSGSYDIVEKAIRHQVMYTPEINTKLTLAPEKIAYLEYGVKHLRSLGLIGVNANCVYEEGWKPEHGKIFYNKLKELADYMLEDRAYKTFFCSLFDELAGRTQGLEENENWCGGTGKMLAIDTQGDIYPCLRYLPFTLENERPSMVIGDIYNGIETNQVRKDIVSELKVITRESQSTEECFTCPISGGCGWCSAYNYDYYGTVNKRATFICITHKARVLANAYYWNKLYRMEGASERFKNNIPKEWALDIVSEEEFNMINDLAKED